MSLKVPELMHESVLLCLMLFIRFSRYGGDVVGKLQKTFFNDTLTYMICILSEMTLFVNADPADFSPLIKLCLHSVSS